MPKYKTVSYELMEVVLHFGIRNPFCVQHPVSIFYFPSTCKPIKGLQLPFYPACFMKFIIHQYLTSSIPRLEKVLSDYYFVNSLCIACV